MPPAEPEHDYFRLRAEWLRFKSHVFDPNTGLPTLAAVLDDVRRLMEERGSLGLVYLDLGEGQLESLHGWQAYDAVLRTFAASLKQLREGGFLTARDIVAVMSVRSDKFLVFLGGSGDAPLDLEGVAAMTRRLCERLDASIPKTLPLDPRSAVSFSHGHALMRRDPMLRAERSLHRALDQAMFMSVRQRAQEEDRRAEGLDRILEGQQVVTLYQPILDLKTLAVLGHEVFTRGPLGSPLEDPESLFALAERTGRLVAVERLCRRQALQSLGRHLEQGRKLFLNTSAGTLRDSEVAGAGFVRQVDAEGLRHQDVVLEISERMALEERQANREALKRLKSEGFRVAIDDMGAGYSSLQSLVELEPDYLKFDVALVRHIDRSVIKRSLLETLVDLAQRIDAQVIAEGIEEESELATLREMGVPLGQGRYLSPPVPVPNQGPATR